MKDMFIFFYNVKGASEVHTINDKGYFVTSTSNMDYGTVTDKYYYIDKSGKRTKKLTQVVSGVWGQEVQKDMEEEIQKKRLKFITQELK
ncbi:hypothetical protein GCM10020331_096440 [Ectobacillus funiculus]